MRFARISIQDTIAFGIVEGDGAGASVTVIDGHPFGPHERTKVVVPMADVRLLPPVLPTKIVGVGKNYHDHAREMGGEAPTTPLLFIKPSTAVVGSGEPIVLTAQSNQVEFEGELAVVIGRLAKDIPVARASEAVLGYTCANDVTARDLQRSDGQWVRAKGFDTFCPLGPWIETEVQHAELAISTSVNGSTKQSASTADMVHSAPELVSFVSSVMTLLPGDVILTGTPAGVGPLHEGDDVEVSIDGIGQLRNTVTAP